MTHILTVNNTDQVFDSSVSFEAWMRRYAHAQYEPIWQMYFNGGNDTFLSQGYFGAAVWDSTWGVVNLHLVGGTGGDTLHCDFGNDTPDGGLGADVLYASRGDEIFRTEGLLTSQSNILHSKSSSV